MSIKVMRADGEVDVWETGRITEHANGGTLWVSNLDGSKLKVYAADEWKSFTLTWEEEQLPEVVQGADEVFPRHYEG